MSIAELLLPEYDHEMATTRRILERVPDAQIEWKPHPKSFPMGHLAQLVARLPGWVPMVMTRNELDVAPKDGPGFPGYSFEKVSTLLAEFDRNAAAGRESIASGTDDAMHERWELKRAGEVIQAAPRYEILREMTLNHIVHHRAQLALYLRILDQKVPPMYGPTADKDMGA